MKNLKKLVAVLMAVMVLALAVPAVLAEDVQPESGVSAPIKAEEPEKTREPEKAEDTSAPDATKAPAAEPEASEQPEATPDVAEEPAAEPTPEAAEEPVAEPTPDATPEPTPEPTAEPTPDAAPAERRVEVRVEDSSLQVGDTLKLTARLTGFDGVKYTLTWQVKAPGEDWKDISGEHDDTLKVTLSEENIGASWRVVVETQE